MAPDEFKGMQVRNDNPAAACYLKSSFIKGNTVTTITYAMGDAGPRLLFNTGDAFSIRKPLITVDQCGRGKGDLVSAGKQPRHWPNQQQETCFSWNDVHTDGTAIGLTSNMPTIHQGSDYINLGKGFPANTIPAQVQAAYPASVNGVAYTQEYPYPHPLTSGSPIPTPTATPTPTPTATATATATSTPTVTVTATATHTFHRASRRDQYTDAEHVVYTVADALNPNANLSNAPIF
jgi:hypothetical protein